jgi:hypothetical protein
MKEEEKRSISKQAILDDLAAFSSRAMPFVSKARC